MSLTTVTHGDAVRVPSSVFIIIKVITETDGIIQLVGYRSKSGKATFWVTYFFWASNV